MKLVRWNPARELSPFENEVGHLFRSFWENAEPLTTGGTLQFLPPLDVSETKDAYRVTAELPGMTQDDVKVSVLENSLMLKGEKKSGSETKDSGPGGATAHRSERRYGRFERILQLASRVDRSRISATMKNGVLEIVIPKTEETREREIDVEVK